MNHNLVLYKCIPEAELARLNLSFSVECFDGVNPDNLAEFTTALKNADALIGSSVNLGKELLDQAPNLKVISTISTGIDCFDLSYLNKRNIALMHTPDVLTETTADTIFALMMCTARRTTELNNLVTSGLWTKNLEEQHYGTDVYGKTLGILGMGRIGYAIAKRAFCGFDMSVNYYNRSVNKKAEQDFLAKKMSLDTLLEQSDFVCCVLPSTADTELLIGKRELNLMKSTAIFINGGRGNVVDEEALIEVLSNQTIRAAGLDVYQVEPLPCSSKLTGLPNVVLFPHIGSATKETRLAMVNCAIDNVIAALEGRLKRNCANYSNFE